MLVRSLLRQAAHARRLTSSTSRLYSSQHESKPSQEELDPFAILNQKLAEDSEASSDIDIDALDWSHLEQPDTGFNEERFSDSAQTRNEQREEMIFKEVLGNVLSSPSRRSSQMDTVLGNKDGSLSSSILSLFESPGEEKQSSVSPSIASLLDGIAGSSKSVASTNAEAMKKRERATAALAEVFARIETLETNRDLIAYYEDIVTRFNESNTLSEDNVLIAADAPELGPETVSYVLEKCIATLIDDLHDPVGALHIFELSKRHSIEYFAESCSADVYNLIIALRWHTYRDLYAVVNLASEIAINAIPPNLGTTEILAKVYRDAVESSSGLSATEYGLPLWTGQDEKRLEELNRFRARFQSAWASKPILRF